MGFLIEEEKPVAVKKAKGASTKGASKKNYFSRNKGGVIAQRNKARRKLAADVRAEYWKTDEGKARKEAKMNTPLKLARREQSRLDLKQRRRERLLASQASKREQAREAADQQVTSL